MGNSVHTRPAVVRPMLWPHDEAAEAAETQLLNGFNRAALDASMLGRTVGRHMQLGLGALHGSIERFQFNEAALRTSTFSTAVRAVIETPADVVTLGIALEAPDPFIIAGERLPAGVLTVFGAGGVNDVRYPAGVKAATLAMPASLYELEIGAVSQLDSLRWPARTVAGQADARLLERLRNVIAATANSEHRRLFVDRQWRSNAERALRNAFFGAIAEMPASSWSAAPPDRLRSVRAIVRAVDARLHDDPAVIPSIPKLCMALGVSRRTLERAFDEVMSISPGHYLRVRALNMARDRLLRSPPTPGVVTRTAIDSGFWHMGRFSVSYRALFGERPIDTVGRRG